MPHSCCVVGCVTRRGSDSRAKGISLFRIPANRRKRAAWIKAISRKNWVPKEWDVVCGRHFVTGWPSDDPENVDYRPTLFMKGHVSTSINTQTPRSGRLSRRNEQRHMTEVAEVIMQAVIGCHDVVCNRLFRHVIKDRKAEKAHFIVGHGINYHKNRISVLTNYMNLCDGDCDWFL